MRFRFPKQATFARQTMGAAIFLAIHLGDQNVRWFQM